MLLLSGDGKWKIALFIIVGIFITFGLNFKNGKKSFIATSEIRPITTFEEDKYRLFNQTPYKLNNNNKYKDIVIQYHIDNKDIDIAKFLKGTEGNIVSFFKITKESLLKQYLEEIKEGTLLEVGIEKFI